MKKYIIEGVVMAFVVWFGWQLYSHNNTKEEAEQYIVTKGDVVETVSASGEVKPVEYANLSFKSPALVKDVKVDVGDKVKKGDKLIIIDRNSLLSDIYAARLEVEKTQAQERLARRDWSDYKPEEKEQIIKNSEQARARLSSLQAQLVNTEITAPISGIVTQKNVRVGEVAQGVVMRIIDESDMDIEVLMSETDVAKMNKGQKAFATFDAYNDEEFPIEIKDIDPEATRVQDVTYYKTTFTLPKNINKNIKSGMSVDVDVVVNEAKNVLTLPLRFVREDENGEYVYTKDATGTYNKQTVKVGVEGDDGDVEIVEGLTEGMTVYAVRSEDMDE